MKRTTVSVRKERLEYAKEHDLNVSAIVRRRLDEIMEEDTIEL
jgi:post-segregation antitoxin (ccd killing protein)